VRCRLGVRAGPADDRVALTFDRDGHVATTKVFNGKSPGTGNVVVLWPIAHRVPIDPTRDVDLNFDGSRIQIPANALSASIRPDRSTH
jgi:hypothetical protein